MLSNFKRCNTGVVVFGESLCQAARIPHKDLSSRHRTGAKAFLSRSRNQGFYNQASCWVVRAL